MDRRKSQPTAARPLPIVDLSSRPVSRAATVLAPRSAAPPTVRGPGLEGARTSDAPRPGRPRRAWPSLSAFAVYLAISTAAWWQLLAHGFGAALPAGSADPAQEVWFLAWVSHALGAGLDPFFSHAVFAPSGVNLLDNTSMELLGLLLAPVTVTAGPVASFDVAVLLAPALSALGAFTLCRRHVTWLPAAFCGGLCYGFGPFLTGDLRYGHLDLTWLVLPPLIFWCLDALLVRGTRRPVLTGAVLGILVVAQFFVSTEMLAITALTALLSAIVMSLGWPRSVVPSLAGAWRGLLIATVIVAAALAYPFWYVVAGPRHFVGPVWHHVGTIAASLAATVEPHAELAGVAFISGSNGSYLGIALLAVLIAGAAALWRSALLRVLLLTALAAYVASLGYTLHVGHRALGVTLPAAALGHAPLLDSIVPERFAAMVDLFCGLALAVIADHLRRWERPRVHEENAAALPLGRWERPRAQPETDGAADGPTVPRAPTHSTSAKPAAPLLVALSLAVCAFALVPFAALGRRPYAVTAVRRPAVEHLAPAVAQDRGARTAPLVAIYPATPAWAADEMVWQAEDGFSFSLADGYAIVPGAGSHAVESPPLDALWLVFAAGSLHELRLPLTRATRAAVLADLRALGVDDVVVLGGAGGSRAVRRALREVLGPPAGEKGGAVRWRIRGTTR